MVAPGYKYNMPDINAAIGLAQLERADILHDQRTLCGPVPREACRSASLNLPRIRVPLEDHAWHLFVVIIKPRARVERGRLIDCCPSGESGLRSPTSRCTA